MRLIDMTGMVFGRLKVKTLSKKRGKNGGARYWKCSCACGGFKVIAASNLTNGSTRSCGCLRSETARAKSFRHGQCANGISPEYFSWASMKRRCNNPKAREYPDYGGRGIKHCKRWNKFENFFQDMGVRPSPDHSLDRKNNDKGYCKRNCKWSTQREQCNNSRRNVYLTFRGKKQTVSEWTRELGLPRTRIYFRLKSGWTIRKILTEKGRNHV